jgi:hypothetical protein
MPDWLQKEAYKRRSYKRVSYKAMYAKLDG